MRQRRINTLTHSPAVRSQKPALLFVHGDYVDAHCRGTHFLPYCSNHGFDCHALDLSGHGDRDARLAAAAPGSAADEPSPSSKHPPCSPENGHVASPELTIASTVTGMPIDGYNRSFSNQ